MSPLILKERIRRADILLVAVVACGLACFFLGREAPRTTAPQPFLGNIIAALSGVTWALTIVGLRWAESRTSSSPAGGRESSMSTVAVGNLLAFLICLPAALPVHHATALDTAAILYLGLFQIGLAYFLLGAGLRYIPAVEAGTLLLIEPALNPVWTWIMHSERPGPLAITGGVLILTASAVRARLR